MALKLGDPVHFLQNLVIKKGRSDTEGVYLTNVTVAASATEDYNYEYDTTQVERDLEVMWAQQQEWHTMLYRIKRYESICTNITFPYGDDQSTVMIFNVDGDLSLHVFIPELDASDFVYDVTYFTSLLQDIARFTGKTHSIVKFTIGYCLLCWDDMVKLGEAREMDVAF
jgi:hypothetical protein